MLRNARDLKSYRGTFGAEALISNFESVKDNWVATAIYTGTNEAGAWESRLDGLEELCRTFGCRQIVDRSPFDGMGPSSFTPRAFTD